MSPLKENVKPKRSKKKRKKEQIKKQRKGRGDFEKRQREKNVSGEAIRQEPPPEEDAAVFPS